MLLQFRCCADFRCQGPEGLEWHDRFFLGTWNMKGFLSEDRPIRTLREVLQRLRESYCGTIGYEVCSLTMANMPHAHASRQSVC